MSAAQLLIVGIGLAASVCTFVLMRFPQHRREQYQGAAFSPVVSSAVAALVLAFCLLLAWAQGRFETP